MHKVDLQISTAYITKRSKKKKRECPKRKRRRWRLRWENVVRQLLPAYMRKTYKENTSWRVFVFGAARWFLQGVLYSPISHYTIHEKKFFQYRRFFPFKSTRYIQLAFQLNFSCAMAAHTHTLLPPLRPRCPKRAVKFFSSNTRTPFCRGLHSVLCCTPLTNP